jgi:hypothetical protein
MAWLRPVATSQIWTVLPPLAVANQRPSGAAAMADTLACMFASASLIRAVLTFLTRAMSVSQIRAVWSALAVASQLPSGAVTSAFTGPR